MTELQEKILQHMADTYGDVVAALYAGAINGNLTSADVEIANRLYYCGSTMVQSIANTLDKSDTDFMCAEAMQAAEFDYDFDNM